MNIVTDIFINLLNQASNYTGGQIGWAIIIVTLVIRTALLPLILPSVRSQRKMLELKPELDKLKEKHKENKEVFAKKQMELYQKNGINPLGGCLPQLVQIGLFIAFYRVLITSLGEGSRLLGSLDFFMFHLSSPDNTYILPVVAAASQFLLGVMLMPAVKTDALKEKASKTVTDKDDKSALDTDAMAKTMQSQMVFVMPVFTLFLALRFPSGLALYWVTSTLFSLAQQYYVSGLGGLKPYLVRFKIIKE